MGIDHFLSSKDKGRPCAAFLWENSKYFKYKDFGNMRGTIYGNGLPKSKTDERTLGTTALLGCNLQVWEPLTLVIGWARACLAHL